MDLDKNLQGKKLVVLGAAFKPNSDDLRDSPSIAIANLLQKAGASVLVHDPISLANVNKQHPNLATEQSIELAVKDADALVLATEWQEYRDLEPRAIGALVKNKLLIEGRNALPVEKWQSAGWRVIALGRNLEASAK